MAKEMKDSGIAWIGEIPKEWTLVSTKRQFSKVKRIVGSSFDSFDRLALTMNGVIKRDKDDNEGLQPEKFDGYQILRKNELVFKLIDLANAKTSRVGLSPFDGIVSPAYIIISNGNNDNRFAYYWFMFMYYNLIFNQLGDDGVRSSLNADDLLNIPFPQICDSEQRLIANFLDEKCGEIDELVALQEKMIDELKAYKQSVITETVTKGLQPNAKMKDSGVEWIGEIPEHWNFTKIKLLAQTTSGSTPRTISNANNANIKWFRTTDINEDVVSDSPIHLTDSEYQSASCPMLEPNTCLVAMYGGAGTIGKFGMLSERATINQALCSISPLPFMNSKYIFHTLKAIRTYWMKFANGTRKDPNINQEIVRNMLIVVPPLSEQHQIATYLDEKCSEIDSLISIKQKKIEELKDYKKSLIYEYVTGKKQVG